MPGLDDAPFPTLATPTAQRPLAGLTVLVVEDSRFASEAVRLMCLRSGARLRRADCLAAAERHLRVYRPSVIIVDLGLPDGSGLDLIEALDDAEPRIPVILATSGEEALLDRAYLAGADGNLPKPLDSLGTFQETILQHLPPKQRPLGPRQVSGERICPDRMALLEDLSRATEVLSNGEDEAVLDYAARFLSGVAKSAHDPALETAADRLARRHASGRPVLTDMARLAGLLQDRLQDRAIV